MNYENVEGLKVMMMELKSEVNIIRAELKERSRVVENKNSLQMAVSSSTEEEIKQSQKKGKTDKPAMKKTYSQVLNEIKKKEKEAKEQRIERINKETEKWTTPARPTTRHQIIGRSDTMEDPKDVFKIVKSALIDKGVNQLKSIRYLNVGGVVLEAKGRRQRGEVEETLKNIENVKMKVNKPYKPKFMITGVMAGYKPEEIIEELKQRNEGIFKTFTKNELDSIKILTKRKCRNIYKENWIVEAASSVYKKILKE